MVYPLKKSFSLLFLTLVLLIIGQPAFANTALPLRDMLPIAKTSPHPPPDPAVQPSFQAEDTPNYLIRSFGVGEVNGVAFSPDGNFAVIAGWANVASLIDLRTGAIVRFFAFGGAVAFSPDGRHILTGSWDDTARLWDVTTGETLRTFAGHTDGVSAVAFSPDGRHILTGSWDDTARLWDVTTGETLRTFASHTSSVSAVAFSPDGRHILTGSYDNIARLWDVTTGETTLSPRTQSRARQAHSCHQWPFISGRNPNSLTQCQTNRLGPLNDRDNPYQRN